MDAAVRVRVYALGLVLSAMFAPMGRAQAPTTSSLTVTPNGDGVSATVSVTDPENEGSNGDGRGRNGRSRGAAGYHSSRVLVRFRSGTSFLPGSASARALSATDNLHVVDTPPGLSVKETVARYLADPNVEYAEPDYEVSILATPNDPEFLNSLDKQWDMKKIAAPAAWDLHTNTSNVVVAVVDTGIDFNHADLVPNLYSDLVTPTIHGYNCIGGTCVPGGYDDNGHGTHVAGTIGAATNNNLGVAGINWSIKLLAIKFLDSNGSGNVSDAVAGFVLLKNLKLGGVNIRVTNNSWGAGAYSQALKDAMAALENTPGYPSTLDVCAAGNSGANADFAPMYPAAYDNRGIVSVLATDSADAGASFTNFGLASTDIAAPGVSIYSTSPVGSCSLCVAAGQPAYRTLNGTSMASPHVAGVAAALLDMFPNLSAAEARDAILHPNSYDWVADPKGQSTSSGGRLNFAKTITNPFANSPVLNGFPSVTVGPDVVTTGGGTVNFTATTSDPDGDTLRISQGRGSLSAWLFGWQLGNVFPSTLPFAAPSLARTAAMNYDTSVADNRGGGAAGRNWAVVSPVASPGGPPTGALTVPATGVVGTPVSISFPATDPQGSPVGWDMWASGAGGSIGGCCYTESSVNLTFNTAGVYRVSVQAMDRELLASTNYTSVISIGGASGVPPIAAATLDKVSGAAPLTVSADMSGSYDPDGSISFYYIGCGGSFAVGTTIPTGSCTFTSPGTYWMMLQVRDNAGLMGLTSKYVVVTPAAPQPPAVVNPSVTLLTPADGAQLKRKVNVALTSTAVAGTYPIQRVDYLLNGSVGCSATGGPTYSCTWKTPASPKTYTVQARVYDDHGNAANSATRTVVVK